MALNVLPFLSPNARIYSAADEIPPAEPGWTRFVCISDTHNREFDLPLGDILLHSGDLTFGGNILTLERSVEWLADLPHPIKIITAGNHELCLDSEQEIDSPVNLGSEIAQRYIRSQSLLDRGVHYLQHEYTTVTTSARRQWKVYGSPSTPMYHRGAFQYINSSEANALYSKVPKDVDIMVTHTPAKGILDTSKRGHSGGCPILAQRLKKLSKCRLHVFGHIHEAFGAAVDAESGRISINAALYLNPYPFIVDLKN